MLLFALASNAEDKKTLELLSVSPAEGQPYSTISNSGYVSFQFSEKVSFDTAYVVDASGTKHGVDSYFTDDSYFHYVYVVIPSTYTKLMGEGKIKEGDDFKVQVAGVKSAADPTLVYGSDGLASVTLKAQRLPAKWLSSSHEDQSEIKSFYKEGDAEGLFSFTFSEPVTAQKAFYAYGDKEAGTYKQVDVPFSSEGNNVVVNMQNIHLEPAALDGATSIMLRVQGLTSADGQKVDCNVASTPGALTMNYNIKRVVVDEITGGFDPLIEDIDKADSINCWVSDTIFFDAVKFDYNLRGKAVSINLPASMASISGYAENAGAINIAVPVKNFNFDAGKVKVSLVNAKDKYSTEIEISTDFESKGRKAADAVMLFSDPAEGKVGANVASFSFVFNDSVKYDGGGFFNVAGAKVPFEKMGMVSVNNNVLKIEMPYGGKTLTGKYSVAFKATTPEGIAYTYGEKKDSVIVNYEYPINSLVGRSIDPKEGAVDGLKEFVVTFGSDYDSQAQVGGFDKSKKVVIKDAEGKVVVETQNFEFTDDWAQAKFIFSDSIRAEGKYTLVIPEATVYDTKFNDMAEDFGVSQGATYNPELTYAYEIGGKTTCELSPAPGEYETMPEKFTLTFSKPVTVSSAVVVTDPMDRRGQNIMRYVSTNGNIVTIAFSEGMLASFSNISLRLQATDNSGAAVTYGDMEGYVTAQYSAKTRVANIFECSAIDPAEGEVEKLNTFTLTFANPNNAQDMVGGFDQSKNITLKDSKGNDVAKGSIDFPADFSIFDQAVITLDKEITAVGTYTLEIPEATIYNGSFMEGAADFGVSNGAIYNPSLSFTYTITKGTGIDTILQADNDITVYSVNGKLAGKGKAGKVLSNLPAGIYVANGKKIIIK